MRFVLDTSVIFKILHEEESTEETIELLSLDKDIDFITSDLAVYECGNALLQVMKRKDQDISILLGEIFSLELDLKHNTKELCSKILENAKQHGITYYDATYSTISEEEDAVLVTEDQELIKKAKGVPVRKALEMAIGKT